VRSLPGAYVDSCVLLSLFLGESGFLAAERWLLGQEERTLGVSHWVLVEFAAMVAVAVRCEQLTSSRGTAIHAEFAGFRQERLSLLEPRGGDFLQAERWLQESIHPQQPVPNLRAPDALHLAMSQRHGLELATADGHLIRAAEQLTVPCCWIRT
jgi:predicted nucleic acid-binding protein